MFIRPCYRNKDGKRHAYWALVESYRTERGPRQRVVAYLGKLDEAGRLGLKQAAEGKPASAQTTFFPELEPEWVEVDANAVRVENCRQFGGPWLALELIKRLGLDKFLQETIPSGREDVPWSVMTLVLIIARLCDPSSELSIAENFSRKTALSDLLGVPEEKVYDNRLYRLLDKLLPHKADLEVFLKEKLGDLFELEYDLLLYDVTSTYFEGEANANPLSAARLLSRQTGRLQAGYDWSGRLAVRHAAGVRGVCRQPYRCDHDAGNRRDDGSPLRQVEPHLGHGSRDGQRSEHRVP